MSDNIRTVRLRDPEDFPEELKFLLNIVTINEVPKVVGSYAYAEHKYPSDVDVFERVSVNLDKESSVIFYADQFRNMYQKLIVIDKFYINDFKAGIYPNGEPIRWNIQEVLQGFSSGGVSLREALSQKAVVKLDIIAWISGKFQSVEVFYNLRFRESGVAKEYLEFYPLRDYVMSLLEDIKMYVSPSEYNPLKVIKRLWSLSRIQNCQDLIEIIDPLLSSDVAALNQLKSDIEILIALNLKFYSQIENQSTLVIPAMNSRSQRWHTDINRMFFQVLSISKRLLNHSNLIDMTSFNEEIFNYWERYRADGIPLDFKYINDRLKSVIDILNAYITSEGKKYLEMITKMGNQCNLTRNIFSKIEYEV